VIAYRDAASVRALTPDLRALKKGGDILYIATAPGAGDPSGADVVSRAFAPGAGIDEDPVTGSAHSVLTPYWTVQAWGATASPPIRRARAAGMSAAASTAIMVELTGHLRHDAGRRLFAIAPLPLMGEAARLASLLASRSGGGALST
jgi:predicted PhzF superfamily epimerase YddE/YHI9